MDLQDLYEDLQIIYSETMDDAFYSNRMLTVLLTVYQFDEMIGNPFGHFDLKKAQKEYNKFKSWAINEIQDMIDTVDEIRTDYRDELMADDEDMDETYADEAAFEAAKDDIFNWKMWENLKYQLNADGWEKIQDMDELIVALEEYRENWHEWDSDFDLYIETMPQRIIEEAAFK